MLALDHNQEVLIANTDYNPRRMEHCVHRMIEHQVDGVAIMTSEMTPELVRLLQRRKIPVVFLDTGKLGPLVSNISINYEHGTGMAIDHLTALQHRRIAFIQGPPRLRSAKIRRDAFVRAWERNSLKLGEDYLKIGNHNIDGGQRAMKELLAMSQPPTAIMCSNDLTAIGALLAAHHAGVCVPEEISVIGFDDIVLSEATLPPLTTIRISRSAIATRAFTALYGASDGGVRRGIESTIDTELIIRQSTGVQKNSRKPGVTDGSVT